jgi:hypothetical protein
MNTASATLADSTGTVPTTAGDGWLIDLGAKHRSGVLVVKFVDGGGGDTVVVQPGVYPPAMTQSLGSLSIALTASQVKYVVLEGARFQTGTITLTNPNDATGTATTATVTANKIWVTCGSTSTKCAAFFIPVGIGGGTGVS